MSIKRECVRKHIGEFTIPVMTVELGEDIETGLLFTIDKATGLAIKADNTGWDSNPKPAIGVIPYSSLEGWGEKFEFNRKEVLKKGERVEVYQFGILYADEIATETIKNQAESIGKPVYLGKEGKLTLKAVSGGNQGLQLVGYVAHPKTGAVRIMLTERGENKA